MTESVFDLQAALCQTMSNANRLRIVHALRQGPLAVSEIARATELSPGQVSHHLTALRSQGLVDGQREGVTVVYHLTNPKIALICDLMREMLAMQAAHRADLVEQWNRSAAQE